MHAWQTDLRAFGREEVSRVTLYDTLGDSTPAECTFTLGLGNGPGNGLPVLAANSR